MEENLLLLLVHSWHQAGIAEKKEGVLHLPGKAKK